MKTMFLAIKEKGRCDHLTILPSEVIVLYVEVLFACSTFIVECNDVFLISDISKCSENFVSQTLGVLTRIYTAELRDKQKSEEPDEVPRFM